MISSVISRPPWLGSRILIYQGTGEILVNMQLTLKYQQYVMILPLLIYSWHYKDYCYFQVKEKVPHWTYKTISAHSISFDLRQEARYPFVVTHYRYAFPLWWALCLCRWLLRRRGLLLLLCGVDQDRCRLDRRRVLRLSWIVCSCCKVKWIHEKKINNKTKLHTKISNYSDYKDYFF